MRRGYWVAVTVLAMAALALGQATSGAKQTGNAATETKLIQMEKDLWEAWKNNSMDTFRKHMAGRSVSVGQSGVVVGTEEALQAMSSANCKVNTYSLEDTKVTWLDKNTALLTYRANQDAVCGGEKVPPAVWASSLWVNERGQWKAAFHQETEAKAPVSAASEKQPE